MKKNLSSSAIAFLLVSLMLISSLTMMSSYITYAQPDSMTFTSGETINFTSDTEMTFKGHTSMQFWSGEAMKFGTNITIQFIEMEPDGVLAQCDWLQIIWSWPPSYIPPACSWWEVIDPSTGELLGEFHIDLFEPPEFFHIDIVYPGPIPVPAGGVITAKKKIDIIEPCEIYVVHWPEHWWPETCSWWEILEPETGELTGYEFHVDWTNESCEFHIDDIIPGPYYPPFPWYEIWARRKIPSIDVCDNFVVEEPPHWWPEPCSWWEILDFDTGKPTGYEFHVDWTNESCEFHIDEIIPEPYFFDFPVPYVIAEQKIIEITPCDWFIIVDPPGFLPDPCSWWEILDDTGAPTGWEFHVDLTDGIEMFHVDIVDPDPLVIPPSHIVTVRQKIDMIQPCEWFRVDDPALTPEPCSWWKIIYPEYLGDIEFHVDESGSGIFHIDDVRPGATEIPPIYELTAEKKIDDIKECEWFKVLDPPDFVPEPCSWWVITWPPVWAGIHFHVDANDDIDMFHIDDVDGGGPPPPPPPPPPWNVTAIPYEPPPLPWYMKASYPDYAPSGMPDFDERQWGTYIWQDGAGRWSHCGPCAVANSMWWLDSEFEPNTIPPPAIIDTYPLVQSYMPGGWDDHDPQNVPPLVEHLAFLMDTDGLRTGLIHSGTDVFDMEAGITHYLSWSGVNPLGDVDGDGNVTMTDWTIVNAAYGTSPGMPGWDLRADIWPETQFGPYVADNFIDMNDLNLVVGNMGLNGSFYEHTVLAPTWGLIVEEVERCQDVVLLIAPWMEDPPEWYRYDEDAHFVTVAGLNATTWEIVLSDPILDNAEAGGYGNVPVPHIHPPPEPPYITHNNASLVSHDAYHVIFDECPGGPLTIMDYPRGPGPYPIWRWQIEAAVITSPYVVDIHDVAVTNLTSCHGSTVIAQNRTYTVNVTVTNEGTTPETFTLSIFWNTTNFINSTSVSLAIGETKLVQLDWNTTGYPRYANYTLSAYATPVLGEVDTADNTFVDPRTIVITYPGDINNDKKVDIKDIAAIAKLYGVNCPDPRYNPNMDITCDCKIDIKDIAIAARNYGYIEP